MNVKLLNPLLKFKWLPVGVLAAVSLTGTSPVYGTTLKDFKILTTRAQSQVTGNVVDEQGKPLPGVSITITGTTIGTMTDVKGNYSLNVPDSEAGKTLSFSFIGYTRQELPINGKNVINISMKPDAGKVLN